MEQTVQVTEQMAEFIKWAEGKGEEEVRKIIREHLSELKAHAEATHNWKERKEISFF